jgi:hypothetical protein
MPWYRVPFDLRSRAERAAARITHRTQAEKATLEIVRSGEAAGSPLFTAGAWIHLQFGSKGNRDATPPCSVCGWISSQLCDWIVNRNLLVHGKPKTCDRALCSSCTHSPQPEKDLCPEHAVAWKAVLAGRTNSTDGEGP